MTYTKQSTPSNLRCKYAINKLHCYFQNTEVFDDNLSIEHLIPEMNGEVSLNIGNLIGLEEKLNGEAGSETYENKLKVYGKSNYNWMKEFIKDNKTWKVDQISLRAKKLAELYFDKILR
jgi:hypothetical protein